MAPIDIATHRPFKEVLRFGAFELEPASGELLERGRRVRLQPQPTKVLAMLVMRAGEVVTRDELRQAIWGADTFVDFERGLNFCINRIRVALHDDPESPRYLETLPKRGYRFIAAVESASRGERPIRAAGRRAGDREQRAQRAAAQQPSSPPPHAKRSRTRAAVLVLVALAGPSAWWLASRVGTDHAAPAAVRRPILVVLPFENLTGEPGQEYFSDGITEELITELARLYGPQLGVMARTTAMQYKRTNKSIQRIASELGADYVLEGSSRKQGSTIRIAVQLIQARDQTHLWAEAYDRGVSDVLVVQREIATAVAGAIRLPLDARLSPGKQPRRVDPGAYDDYVRGRYFWNKRTDADLQKAIEYFERSIARDPSSALAYSGLADAHFYSGYAFGSLRPVDAMPRAAAAARRALELDGDLAEAHTSLALVKLFYDWDWRGAEEEFRTALALNPDYPTAHHGYAVYLWTIGGSFERAMSEASRALELDPVSVPVNNIVALLHHQSGRADETIARSRRILELAPDYRTAHEYLAWAYDVRKLPEQAFDALVRAATLDGASPVHLATLRGAYAGGGMPAAWRSRDELTIREAERQPPPTLWGRWRLASAHAALGQREKAFHLLEDLLRERYGMLIWLARDPAVRSLQADARYTALVRAVGLTE